MGKTTKTKRSQLATLRASRMGFVFIFIYGLTTIIYKLWKLQTPDVLRQRWIIILILLILNVIFWQISKRFGLKEHIYKFIIALQIATYMAISIYSIYSERGMDSNAIILFVIPLIIAGLEYNGRVLFAVTSLCAVSYGATAIRYFEENPSEGYKIELYGGILFYSGILYLISALVWILIKTKDIRK
jgi:hypothetical protein